METFKIVRICNHTSTTYNRARISKSMIRTPDQDTDIVDSSNIVAQIIDVRDHSGILVDKSNYTLYLHNSIKWLTSILSQGSTYYINYIYVSYQTTTYNSETCPICSGFNWYADFVDVSYNILNTVSGKYKIAQEFLKILLTNSIDSRLDVNYGAGLSEIISKNMESDLESAVTSNILSAESYYKKLQLSESSLANDERLAKVVVNNISVTPNSTGVYINLTLVSKAVERLSVGFNISG